MHVHDKSKYSVGKCKCRNLALNFYYNNNFVVHNLCSIWMWHFWQFVQFSRWSYFDPLLYFRLAQLWKLSKATHSNTTQIVYYQSFVVVEVQSLCICRYVPAWNLKCSLDHWGSHGGSWYPECSAMLSGPTALLSDGHFPHWPLTLWHCSPCSRRPHQLTPSQSHVLAPK